MDESRIVGMTRNVAGKFDEGVDRAAERRKNAGTRTARSGRGLRSRSAQSVGRRRPRYRCYARQMAAHHNRNSALHSCHGRSRNRLVPWQVTQATLNARVTAMLSGVRRETRSIPASSMLWSVLFSTTLVGVMFATEMGRIYRSQSPQSSRPAAPTFGTSPVGERGHGRLANMPWQIPLRGWKDILWRTYEQIDEDRLLAVAAGVVFYGLLAVFPAITALVSLYGLFASPSAIGEHLSIAAGILPQGAMDILGEQINPAYDGK